MAIFALSVIFFFVAVIGGDGAWKVVHNVYLGLFGMLAAVLFPILAVAIILLYSYKENKAKKRAMEEGTAAQKSPVSPRELIAKGVESVIIVLLIAALIHIIENPTGLKFADSVKLGYTQAPYEFNGGFFGALIGWALLTFGKAPGHYRGFGAAGGGLYAAGAADGDAVLKRRGTTGQEGLRKGRGCH